MVVMSFHLMHTPIQYAPLNQYAKHLRLDIIVARILLFTPNRIMYGIPPLSRCLSPLQRAREGCLKEDRNQANYLCYICSRVLHSFQSFAHCRTSSTAIPQLLKATSHHLSNPTSVYPVPTVDLFPVSTPYCILPFYSVSSMHFFIPNSFQS